MNNQLVCPINLSFDIDWNRIRNIYTKLTDKKNQGIFPKTSTPYYTADRYDFGNYGSFISSTSLTDGVVWNVWGGPLLDSLLPQNLLQFKQTMIDSGLNFINFNYFQHNGNVGLHCDGKNMNEAPKGHCNINYIVTCNDPLAKTTAYSDHTPEYSESYSGSKNWWLIDTAVLHKVDNSGFREVFQIKIFDPYSRVKDFFVNRNEVIQ
jgi:hypothetical protein